MQIRLSPLRTITGLLGAALFASVAGAGTAMAQNEAPSASPALAENAARPTLRVATKPAPPFAMLTDSGTWSGLAIDLMGQIAEEMDREIDWVDAGTTARLIDRVATGEADLGIAAVTITSERERIVDFSHPYYDSGLAIAVPRNPGTTFLDVLRALSSPAFLTTVGTLSLLLLATGAVIWVVERNHNAEQFDKDPIKGIGNGFWWSAVTMTTVGYGDKAPVTPLGRAIAVVWMFAALILTAVFTAQLASSLTVGSISGPVKSLSDLNRARVGVVADASSNAYFDERFIRATGYRDVQSGLAALVANEIDAFVHDEPILKFRILRDYPGDVDLLPQIFEPQDYGIVLPQSSALREELNQALLAATASDRWGATKRRYFGGGGE